MNVRIAPTFFGWLFRFGTETETVSPESLKEEYKLLFTKETEKGRTTPLKEQKHFLRKKRCFLPWLVQF